jgi:hypothetical protein
LPQSGTNEPKYNATCELGLSLGDLLADLMHWSEARNFDFEAALLRARDHYAAELTEAAAKDVP